MMIVQRFIAQPAGGIDYLQLFRTALECGRVERIDAAVAYATRGGVVAFDRALRALGEQSWIEMEKRWLVGIDYCRSEPRALRKLQQMPNSVVRIYDGETVVGRKRCMPVLPYHPKTYILWGPDLVGAICGSGNLSRNGLTKGHEVGNVMMTSDPQSEAELLIQQMCMNLSEWFDCSWRQASELDTVLSDYTAVYDSEENKEAPPPTDDDTASTDTLSRGRLAALSPEDLVKLRVCEHLWIEAGNLTKNRGEDRPGDQLMMKRFTRVFFGFAATDLPRNTSIGHLYIAHGGRNHDCSLRFGHNGMDVLYLPVPGENDQSAYDQKTLLFETLDEGGFRLSVGTGRDKRSWRSRSRAIGACFSMTSGRQWGIF